MAGKVLVATVAAIAGAALGATATLVVKDWHTIKEDFNRGVQEGRRGAPVEAPPVHTSSPAPSSAPMNAPGPIASASSALPPECHDSDATLTLRYLIARKVVSSSAAGSLYAQGEKLATDSDEIQADFERRKASVLPKITVSGVVQDQLRAGARKRWCKASLTLPRLPEFPIRASYTVQESEKDGTLIEVTALNNGFSGMEGANVLDAYGQVLVQAIYESELRAKMAADPAQRTR